MLKKFGLEDSKPMKSPMSFDTKLTKGEECESVDSTKYRGMIEMLKKFGLDESKPMKTPMSSETKLTKDEECESVDKAPKTSHLEAVKRIFQYIKGTMHLGLWYPKGTIKETIVSLTLIMREIMWTERILALNNESYVLYDRVMTPLAAQLERKPIRDRGMRRGRHSTSSSSAFEQPSSSHLNDDDDDGNDEGTSRASTPSLIHYVNSLTNQVPQVFQNPPNIDPHLKPFYTRQTKIINRQVQLRDEHRCGVRSIGKSLKRLWRNMKK
ncbi:hypothetical protein Tco_1118654 [Tanacetum coccineum]